MTTLLMDAPPTPQHPTTPPAGEDDISRIIANARSTQPGLIAALFPPLASAILLWLAFTPVDFGPVAWLAVVPMLLQVRVPLAPKRMYLGLYAGGLVYWLATLQWMRLGDPSMYFALLFLAVYLAVYWPVYVGLSRVAVHRFGFPLFVVAPTLWVGLEYLRAHLFTGFAWYLLGHTQHRWIEIIQISDVTGGYGVSFLIVAANACAATYIPLSWLLKLGYMRPAEEATPPAHSGSGGWMPVMVTLLVIGSAWSYGTWRRHQVTFTTGPKVALIQGNFPAYVRNGMTMDDLMQEQAEIYRTHRFLTGMAVPYQPDVIVWPEGMYRYPLLQAEQDLTSDELQDLHSDIPPQAWFDPTVKEDLLERAQEANAALVLGLDAHAASHRHGYQHFNSAVHVDPQRGLQGRYDKIHRVIFGEYIPLSQIPGMSQLTPYGESFGIDAGDAVKLFRHKEWTMVPVICFEDTVPHLVRSMVGTVEQNGDQVDCLVNLTNDGWFHGSSELDQHLITAKFRCIETRTPMVRAVNTGISAIIDGDGVIREPEAFIDHDSKLDPQAYTNPRTTMRDPQTGKFHKQLNCALVGDVPLDPRTSIYVRWGDWFGLTCLACTLATLLHTLLIRPK